VVVVAQRVLTIVDADQIVVLEDGEVVGLGTHESLLATCPTYAEIVESQHPRGRRMTHTRQPPRPAPHARARRDDDRRPAGREVDGLLAVGQPAAAPARAGTSPAFTVLGLTVAA
jgi:hypothetical protein